MRYEMTTFSDDEIIRHFSAYAYRSGVRHNTMQFLHFQTADLVAATRLLLNSSDDTSNAITKAAAQ